MTTTQAAIDSTTLPDEPPAAQHTLLQDSLVFVRRNFEHVRQIPEKLLDVTLQPLMFVLLFSYVFGGAINIDGGNYREYLLGGILVQTLAFGLMGPAVAISTDLSEGVIDRFRSLPTARSAYLLGHFISELLAILLAISILMGTGFAIGWRTHRDIGYVAMALALLFVFASLMIWVGTWLGMKVRSADSAQGIVFVVVFPLTFVSNAFVPIGSMPDVLQWIAALNPVSTMIAAVRELFGNPTTPVTKDVWPATHPVAAAWLYCALLLVAIVPLALRQYRRRIAE